MAAFGFDDLAIDLGTSTTRIYSRAGGLVASEPSLVARDENSGEVLAVGHAALAMLGRTRDGIEDVRAVRGGVVADFEAAQALVSLLVGRARRRLSLRRSRVVLAVPSELTGLELRGLCDALRPVGARSVHVVDAPLAAALGAGVQYPAGRLVVDVGAGTIEVALISRQGEIHARSARVGGDAVDETLHEYLKRQHDLTVGERSVERIKRELGEAKEAGKRKLLVSGLDRVEGTPRGLEIDEEELRQVLTAATRGLVDAIAGILMEAPPALCAEIAGASVLLCGAGGQLFGLAQRIEAAFRMPVTLARQPADAVILGCGMCLDDLDQPGPTSRLRLAR